MRRAPRLAHGMTLLEVMISMSVLLIGLLGMMHLQIWGMNSNQGARAQMIATELGREVAASLQRLPYGDARLVATATFGGLLQADGSIASGFRSGALPNVRDDASIESDGTTPMYQRRWTVRDIGGTKAVAVSVVYRERGIPRLKEVVLFAGRVNSSLLSTNIGAFN